MNRRILFACLGLIGLVAPRTLAVDRALLIGINDYADPRIDDLRGCEDDAAAVGRVLTEQAGLAEDQVRILRSRDATAAAIRRSVETWLIEGTAPGDRAILFYSGHGSQKRDANGDEADGRDEVLCPVDFGPESGDNAIVDDEIAVWLNKLDGRNVTVMIDACHSGSLSRNIGGTLHRVDAIDTPNARARFIPPPAEESVSRGIEHLDDPAGEAADRPRQQRVLQGDERAGTGGGIIDEARANYVLYTACADYQRAEEIRVFAGGKRCYRGAFTWMLIRGLSSPDGTAARADANGDGTVTNNELLQYIEQAMQEPRYDLSQKPELRTRSALVDKPVFGRILAVGGAPKVLEVRDRRVTINRGTQHDVEVGQVYRLADSRDAGGGGRVRIEEVEQFVASGRLLDGRAVPGQLLRQAEQVLPEGLRVCLEKLEGDGAARIAGLLREQLQGSGDIHVVDTTDEADCIVTVARKGGRYEAVIAGRHGMVRSRHEYTDPAETAAGLARCLRAEQMVRRLAAVSPLAGSLRVDLAVAGDRTTFVARSDPDRQELVRFTVQANRDCHLVLLSVDYQGEVRVLFPNKWQQDTAIRAGRQYTVPSPDSALPGFVVMPPAGRDIVKAIVMERPLPLAGVNTRSLGEQGFVCLPDGSAAVDALLRSLPGVREAARPGADTQPQAPATLPAEVCQWGTAEIVVNTVPE